MSGPCGWTPTHTHHSAADLAEWNALSSGQKSAADAAASMALWSATGRQFGPCPQVARPIVGCVHRSEVDLVAAPHQPVQLDAGVWTELPAGGQCCLTTDPMRARLLGPVTAVTEISIDGVVLATGYRVDDGQMLVRTDGNPWPLWQDINLPSGAVGTFVVKYTRGIPVPAPLLAAAGTYALEWARASVGGTDCRLPSRVSSISRQGVDVEFVDPTALLERGLTGLPDVDPLILAYNPTRQIRPPRVLAPGYTAPLVSA